MNAAGLNSGLSPGMQDLLGQLQSQETAARSTLAVAIARANAGMAVDVNQVRQALEVLDWHGRELTALALKMSSDPRDEHAGPSPIAMSLGRYDGPKFSDRPAALPPLPISRLHG